MQQISDETWAIAVRSAASQFEIYVHQGKASTPDQRKVALSDALAHAIGIIRMRGQKNAASAPANPDQ